MGRGVKGGVLAGRGGPVGLRFGFRPSSVAKSPFERSESRHWLLLRFGRIEPGSLRYRHEPDLALGMVSPVTRYTVLLPSLPSSDGTRIKMRAKWDLLRVSTSIVDVGAEMTLSCSYPQYPSSGFSKLTCNA